MTPLKLSLVTGSLVAMLTVGGHYYVGQGRMQEAVRLRTENDRLRFEASRQYQVKVSREEVGPGKVHPATLIPGPSDRAMMADVPVDQSGAESQIPGAEYRNEGQATQVAAMQTLAWCCDQGDADRMERLIHFDEAARPKAEAFFQSLPPQVRAQWANLEAMAAALLISSGLNSPYPPASVIAQARVEELGAGRRMVHLPGTSRERMEFQETADGWKYGISEAMVDDYIRRSRQPAPSGN